VDAVTDNRNRTASEVRSSFTKYGGNLGETGSVSFMFNNVGHILYQKDIKNDDEILEIAIEVGADDVISDEISHEIITSLNEFNNVRDKLENLLGSPEQAEIIWQPENYIKVDDEKRAASILKLLDTLDNCEDVQGVYGNFDISEEIINKVNI
jgi:YebC/PmpR family DNA-binding regulatory protein